MDESMPGLSASVELVNLSVEVEVAHQLAVKMRRSTGQADRERITRTEEHRLLEAVTAIATILEVTNREAWVDYVESPWCFMCGHGCACGTPDWRPS